jgi:NAD(P)H-hydrate epimerase
MVSSGSHKGNFGHVLSLAGSRGMMGAALLSARAVLRSGGGLVTSAVPTTLADGFDLAFAEGMTLALEETTEGGLDLSVADQLTQVLADKAVFLAGPGLKQHENLPLILEQVISSIEIPAVLDAGALWAISQNDDIVKGAKGPLILTPHPGELAHLLGTTAELVQKDRCGAARSAAKEFNSIVILKGAGTIIADSQGSMFINASGNAALAIAGSGDVLAGAVAAWLAQGLQPLSAAILATYLHGAAGQRMSQELGLRGGLAGEVAELLPLLRQALETK